MIRFFVPLLLLMACGGPRSNPNTAFVTTQDKDRIDVLLTRAQVEFDRNKLDKAEEYASLAYSRNPSNQKAARKLASIYVSQGQLSILDIASRVSSDLKTSSSSSSASNTQALDVLGVLQDVVGISEADFLKLGDFDNSTSTYFTNLKVINPNKPGSLSDTSSPRFTVKALRQLNKSIAILCPFVSTVATNGSNDARHDCKKVANSNSKSKAQVHFAFAMSHLLEAIYFNAVIQYTDRIQSSSSATAASQNSNLFKRVQAIQSVKFSLDTFNDYVTGVSDLVVNIDKIFDTSSTSMLTATMVDLRVTAQSLTAIDGFPQSMIEKINGVITNIQNALDKAGKSKTDISGQTDELKKQLNEALLTKLNTSINTYLGTMTDAQKTSVQSQLTTLCNSVASVTGGVKPTACP